MHDDKDDGVRALICRAVFFHLDGVAQDGGHTPANRLRETCNLGLLRTSLRLDIHVIVN